jgi:hypothetical protein
MSRASGTSSLRRRSFTHAGTRRHPQHQGRLPVFVHELRSTTSAFRAVCATSTAWRGCRVTRKSRAPSQAATSRELPREPGHRRSAWGGLHDHGAGDQRRAVYPGSLHHRQVADAGAGHAHRYRLPVRHRAATRIQTLVGFGPRLSLVYDLLHDHTTLLKAHYGRHNDLGNAGIADYTNPTQTSILSALESGDAAL